MTYVSVSDCRPNYSSVTKCSAVVETVNYMKFSQLFVAVTKAYCTLSHVANCIISWIIYFKVWLKLPSGSSVCSPVIFIKIVLVLSTARKVLEPIPYPTGIRRFLRRTSCVRKTSSQKVCHTKWYTACRLLRYLVGTSNREINQLHFYDIFFPQCKNLHTLTYVIMTSCPSTL